MNKNNYIYLGSTNNTVFNNMGVTLEEDGSLLLIRRETKDLFTGGFKKYFKDGFDYDGFHIKGKNNTLMKFKEIYVDSNGDLIGSARNREQVNGSKETDNKLYRIKFNKIENEFNLNKKVSSVSLNDKKCENDFENIYIEHKEYIPNYTERHDLVR